ncbi:BLOC-1-related complex subunit 8 homolog [Musca vetustissima]|uniref:BLOC-1-related complex subunit 8 homolog n=1 Tax=Musca vetustissima TaxID=27455 RepID=UPI002AB769B2|nr:BLOC-1-related complex subunit 8 homolog [Musca vetustissima]
MSNNQKLPSQNTDLTVKVRKSSEKLSENIHIVANDPSLAFYRIQEHVRKVLQPILDKRIEVIELQKDLQGHCFDMEYAVRSMKDIEASGAIFSNIQDMVKNSIFLKQQLKYEEIKGKAEKLAHPCQTNRQQCCLCELCLVDCCVLSMESCYVWWRDHGKCSVSVLSAILICLV